MNERHSDINTLFEETCAAALEIREHIAEIPGVAVVLGSGLGDMADRLTERTDLSYGTIPHFPVPTVEGHAGKLVVGRLSEDGPWVIMLRGRSHYYEGHDLKTTTFYVRVLRRLGVKTLILTASTGAINTNLPTGSIVCLSDHLNLIGWNPLRGPNDARFGPRFPDMTRVYSERLRALAAEVARELGEPLTEGVYACLPGPSYETPAEIRMLRTLGADVVGMSTVPEAIVARHCGMEVLGFAVATNPAAGVTGATIHHGEVEEQGRKTGPTLARIIEGVIAKIDLGERRVYPGERGAPAPCLDTDRTGGSRPPLASDQ